MTELLKKAFDVAAELSEDEQNKVAEWLLSELATEKQWEKRFLATGKTPAHLAREGSTPSLGRLFYCNACLNRRTLPRPRCTERMSHEPNDGEVQWQFRRVLN